MAFLFLVHLLCLGLTLTTAVSPFKVQVRHDGKAHHHKQVARREGKQGGPVGGIGVISPSELQTPPPASLNSGFTSTAKPVVVSSSNSQVAPLPSYSFIPTVIQVPVATVCPDTPSSNAIFSILPVSSLLAAEGINSTGLRAVTRTTINATALLPNGSSTVFLSSAITSSRQSQVTNGVVPTARIVLDINGCQTIFSPTTTAICDTTVQLVGMPSVSVTDCNQWITFSSGKSHDCASSPDPNPTSRDKILATQQYPVQKEQAAKGTFWKNNAASQKPPPTSVAEDTVKGKGKIEPIAVDESYPPQQPQSPTHTPSPSSEFESEASSETDSSLIPLTPINLTCTFYLAHWTDLLFNGVPTLVRVKDCAAQPAPTAGLDCTTSSEKWSVTHATRTRVVSSVVAFSGPATLTIPPVPPRTQIITVTTTLSFNTTQTRLATSVTASVVRRRITSVYPSSLLSSSSVPVEVTIDVDDADEEEATSTLHVTVPTTRVVGLERVTETKRETVRRTRTEVRTRIRTRSEGTAGTVQVAGAG